MTLDKSIAEDTSLNIPTNEPKLKYSLKDKWLVFKTEIDAIHSEINVGLRKLSREIKYLIRGMDLIILIVLFSIFIISLFLISVIIIPLILTFFPSSIFVEPFIKHTGTDITSGWQINSLTITMLHLWTDDTTLRIAIGAAGILGLIFRLLQKRDIERFSDKVKSKKEVTYIFGSTIYAEKFCHQMVHAFGYDEQIALISDKGFLWVENIAGLLDTYTIQNPKEFDKENFYKMVGFNNAKRIMILTDNVEYNQAILTNLRSVNPTVPIFILSQYTPAFLDTKLVEDPNTYVINDLEMTNKGLGTSLSLDIIYPECAEINVPRTFVGRSAEYITKDTPTVEILAIKRPNIDSEDGSWIILPPTEILQRTD
ncbi:MAG: hypothetical protein ACFFD1_15385, partial [Candidatus Thorarchaeota archaeon]